MVNSKRQASKNLHIPTRRAATIQSPLEGGISYIMKGPGRHLPPDNILDHYYALQVERNFRS